MARSQNILFFNQIVIAFWMLIIMSIGLFIATTVLLLRDPNTKKHPGINIKEF